MAGGNKGKSTTILIVIIVILLIIIAVMGVQLIIYKNGSLGKLTSEERSELASIDVEHVKDFVDLYSDSGSGDKSLDVDDIDLESNFSDEITEYALAEANIAISLYQKAVEDAVENPTTDNYEALLKFLDSGYVKDKGLNSSNLSRVINKKIDYTITKILCYTNDSYHIYATTGIYVNPDDSQDVKDGYQIAIITTTDSDYFSILPNEALNDGSYNMVANEKPNYSFSKAYRGDNTLESYYNQDSSVYDEELELVRNYMKMFKLYAFVNTEKAYNLLEENYRNSQYGSLDKFKKYVSSNSNEVYALDIVSSKYYEYGDEDEDVDVDIDLSNYNSFEQTFECVDNNGNTLIIKQNKLFDFTIAYED